MTDEHILKSLRKTNSNATMRDVDAARRFMRRIYCGGGTLTYENHINHH